MKVKFAGAARMVTGSSHLLTLDNGFKILLDCGLAQGRGSHIWDLNNKWHFDPKEVDCMILSHAHIDHSGRVPQLVKAGFNGHIFSTHATRSLCSIMLLDSAKIQEADVEYYNQKLRRKRKKKNQDFRVALYGPKDVPVAMEKFVGHSYEDWFEVAPGVEVLFRDQGHILGSASVTIKVKEEGKKTKMFGFTGDIGRPDRPILRDPMRMPEVDYLICESTYGGKEHESSPEQSQAFLDIVKETCLVKKGKLIIPAFSIGRTQEIVYMMDKMETAGLLPKIPVFVDSPLATNATHVYGTHPECYDETLQEYLLTDDDPFGFNSLRYTASVNESKQLNNMKKPAIIISSSGMMNAGRIVHHMYNNIEDPKNTFLIVGYCSPGTPGGMLREGVTEMKIHGEIKKVNAEIKVMESFSAHADRVEMLDFLGNQKKLKKIYLVHGEIKRQESFKQYLEDAGLGEVIIPDLGEEYSVTRGKLKNTPKKKAKKKIKDPNHKQKDYPAKSKNRKANLEKRKSSKKKSATPKSKPKSKTQTSKKAKPSSPTSKKAKAIADLVVKVKSTKKPKSIIENKGSKFSKKKRVRPMDSSNHWKKKK